MDQNAIIHLYLEITIVEKEDKNNIKVNIKMTDEQINNMIKKHNDLMDFMTEEEREKYYESYGLQKKIVQFAKLRISAFFQLK